MVIVGGIGSLWGGVLGAVFLVWLLEVLRTFRDLQEIAFGGLLLFTVLVVPGGAIVMIKRYLPGWNEPLRRIGKK
jgi:branched-chain amino acid transport system permease protein